MCMRCHSERPRKITIKYVKEMKLLNNSNAYIFSFLLHFQFGVKSDSIQEPYALDFAVIHV